MRPLRVLAETKSWGIILAENRFAGGVERNADWGKTSAIAGQDE